MFNRTSGIHHITAFARHPQENVDFYAGVLGLRLIKKTVNFDAPHVYHLYFGDEAGSPGTILTFFPWSEARQGRVGGGQVGITTFVIPPGSIGFWEQRLASRSVVTNRSIRFGETYVQFTDSEGLRMELVEREEGLTSTWEVDGITADYAIKGFGGAVLFSTKHADTIDVLERVLGLVKVGEDAGYARFQATAELGNLIDVPLEDMHHGSGGAGTVHHIAWRTRDDDEQLEWRESVARSGYAPTEVKDRQYFKAIYFRESGGILFEIATDPPGFARDEEPEELGHKLMLPEWYEPNRAEIEAILPLLKNNAK